jgi:hypothetical protein
LHSLQPVFLHVYAQLPPPLFLGHVSIGQTCKPYPIVPIENVESNLMARKAQNPRLCSSTPQSNHILGLSPMLVLSDWTYSCSIFDNASNPLGRNRKLQMSNSWKWNDQSDLQDSAVCFTPTKAFTRILPLSSLIWEILTFSSYENN